MCAGCYDRQKENEGLNRTIKTLSSDLVAENKRAQEWKERAEKLEAALDASETLYRQSRAKCEQLQIAIMRTLDENGHLADGDVRTLKVLKDAVGIE